MWKERKYWKFQFYFSFKVQNKFSFGKKTQTIVHEGETLNKMFLKQSKWNVSVNCTMYWLEKVLILSNDNEFLGGVYTAFLGITIFAPKHHLSAQEVTAQLDKEVVS